MLVMNASSILAAGEITLTFILEVLLSGIAYDSVKNLDCGGEYLKNVIVIGCAVMVRASGPAGTCF